MTPKYITTQTNRHYWGRIAFKRIIGQFNLYQNNLPKDMTGHYMLPAMLISRKTTLNNNIEHNTTGKNNTKHYMTKTKSKGVYKWQQIHN